jgi:hypothetical protein
MTRYNAIRAGDVFAFCKRRSIIITKFDLRQRRKAMAVSKLFVSAALVTAALLAFLQLGLTSASAGRGCKMGADCYYNLQGHGGSHQARQPVDKNGK